MSAETLSTDTQELIRTYEQLPEAKRIEVADFARFLLSRQEQTAGPVDAAERWLAGARGVTTNVTTESVMTLTRGEP